MLRHSIKVLKVSVVLIVSFFGASLYASDTLVATPSPHSKILNPKQSVEAAHPNQGAWLLLAFADHNDDDDLYDDDDHKRDCERRDRRGKCPSLKKLKVNKRHELKFGAIVSNGTGGTRIIIDPVTGNKIVFAGVDLGGRSGPALFEVKGQPNKRFIVTLPRQIVLTGKTGNELQVTELTTYLPSSRGPRSRNGDGIAFGYLGKDGKAKIFIGGTLLLGPRQPTGKFKAPFDVIVDYVP